MRFKAFKILGAAIVAALVASSAGAEPTARQLELSRRYIADIHLGDQIELMMKNVVPTMMAQAEKNSKLSPQQKSELNSIVVDAVQEYMIKVIDKMPPVMAETFTEAELVDLVTFYESPTGRSLVAKSPEMSARMMPVVMGLLPEMQARLKARICAKFGCPATPSVAPSPS